MWGEIRGQKQNKRKQEYLTDGAEAGDYSRPPQGSERRKDEDGIANLDRDQDGGGTNLSVSTAANPMVVGDGATSGERDMGWGRDSGCRVAPGTTTGAPPRRRAGAPPPRGPGR